MIKAIFTINTGKGLTAGKASDLEFDISNCPQTKEQCSHKGHGSCYLMSTGGDYRDCTQLQSNKNSDFQVHQIGTGGDNI